MRIGELAKTTGIGIDAIRFYERHGLLPEPKRRESGYRTYAVDDVRQLQFIARAKQLGFSLQEIRELLELSNARDTDVASVKAATEKKLQDVERRLAEMTHIRDGLRTLIERCPGHGSPEDCPILGALCGDQA